MRKLREHLAAAFSKRHRSNGDNRSRRSAPISTPTEPPQPALYGTSALPTMTYRILVGSYTSDVTTLEFDPDARTLQVISALTVGHHPSWLTRHPSDPTLVYTGLEQTEGKILAFKVDSEGTIKVVGEANSGGADPASLEALEEELIVGNVRLQPMCSITALKPWIVLERQCCYYTHIDLSYHTSWTNRCP